MFWKKTVIEERLEKLKNLKGTVFKNKKELEEYLTVNLFIYVTLERNKFRELFTKNFCLIYENDSIEYFRIDIEYLLGQKKSIHIVDITIHC